MGDFNLPRDRSFTPTHTSQTSALHESYSESISEELGAVGGQQVVRHEHHHHHHHHIHYVQDDRAPPAAESLGHRRRARRSSTPEFRYQEGPPSYAEATRDAPTPASGAIPRNHSAPVAIPASPPSPARHRTSPPERRDSPISRRPQRNPVRRAEQRALQRRIIRRLYPATDQSSSSSLVSPSNHSESGVDDDVLRIGEHSSDSPEHQEPIVYSFSSSPSPTVSVLSLESDDSFQQEPSSIRYAREVSRNQFYEAIYQLQQRSWNTLDSAWGHLVRKLFGKGRCAFKEAEVAWEFAFRAPSLSDFGRVFRDENLVRTELRNRHRCSW